MQDLQFSKVKDCLEPLFPCMTTVTGNYEVNYSQLLTHNY